MGSFSGRDVAAALLQVPGVMPPWAAIGANARALVLAEANPGP